MAHLPALPSFQETLTRVTTVLGLGRKLGYCTCGESLFDSNVKSARLLRSTTGQLIRNTALCRRSIIISFVENAVGVNLIGLTMIHDHES